MVSLREGFSLRLVSSAVVAALWGTKRRSRCREIVLTLFVKGHLVDPSQNASYQCLRQLRRMAEQRPKTFAELERVWRCYPNGDDVCDGPAVTAHSVLQGMGWHWQAPTLFTREGRPHLRLLDDKRQFDCQRACCVVRNLMMNKICSRGARGGKRFEKQAPSNSDHLTWPPCSSKCGIFLEDPEPVAWTDRGPSACAQSIRCNTLPDNVLSDARFERETQNHDFVVAWTDGACVCKPGLEVQKSRLRGILQHQR